jgi:hypothetical protein
VIHPNFSGISSSRIDRDRTGRRSVRSWLVLAFGLSLVSTLAVLGLAACDDASPVAPDGTILSISANPDRIPLTGESQIRVVARKPNGNPVNPGTLIRFSTTLGDITPSLATDSEGEVVTVLKGTGQQGTASVRASAGSSEEVSVDITVGLAAGSISLQATPAAVSEAGGTVSLLAIVRDDQGQALSETQVNFRTDTGTLESGGQLISTDSGGAARDVLTVGSADVEILSGDTFQVTAEVGGGGALLSGTTSISIQRLPVASFTFGTNNLTAVFTDTSTGNPTSWQWDFGDGNRSTQQNPSHTYSAPGTYVVELIARNSLGSASTSEFVQVGQ